MSVTRGKTICFIDNANIFHGQQDAGWRIDWRKLSEHFAGDGEIWQTYFFASVGHPPRPEEEAFFNFLKEQLRWEVMTYSLGKRTLVCSNCDYRETVPAEKGVDVGLATKMLMLGMNQAYETAILVAGDRDYLETVVFLKGFGLRVEVVAWRDNLSDLLASESSAPVLYLDTLKAHIEKQS